MKNQERYKLAGMYTIYYHYGRYADWGDFALQAAQLAIEDINKSKMLDKDLEMPEEYIADYHCWPENVEKITNELFSKDKNILALTGVDCSGPAVIMAQECEKWKIPAVSYGVSASEFSNIQDFPYFLRLVTPSEIFDGYLLVLAKELGLNDLVFCHTTDSWGMGAKKVVEELAIKYDVTLKDVLAYERDTSLEDMIVHIQKYKEKDYKNYLIIAPTPDTVTVFKAFHALDMNKENMRIFAGEMVSADEKEDVIYGSYGYIAPMTDVVKSEQLTSFIQRFEKILNKELDLSSKAFAFAALSYDHIYFVAHGIKLLLENKEEVNSENLTKALRKVDFQGLTGRIALISGTNDRDYMNVSFRNNQGYHADGSVNFVPVGSLDTSNDKITFDYDKVRWPGTRNK